MADLDSESDLDMTGVGPVLPTTLKAPAAEAEVGTEGVAKGNPPVVLSFWILELLDRRVPFSPRTVSAFSGTILGQLYPLLDGWSLA